LLRSFGRGNLSFISLAQIRLLRRLGRTGTPINRVLCSRYSLVKVYYKFKNIKERMMAKGRDAKKSVKKKSEKTLKEKRAEKKEKKANKK
jgi:hypothetical protein